MRTVIRSLAATLCAVAVFGLSVPALGQISCGGPPKADKQRRKAAEGFAPLPLPATPLRRSEKKRPPAPPTLMAKVNYVTNQVRGIGGLNVWDWTQAAGDTKELFNVARAKLGINYKADVVRLDQFSWSPERVPIMYFAGREAVRFSEEEKLNLRNYVEQGGWIFGDASSGSENFARAFRAEMQSLYPDRPWYRLPGDHPLYSSHFNITKVAVNVDGKEQSAAPEFEGLNIGFRTAIILSPVGIDCGWDGHTHDKGMLYLPEDAQKLGVNLLAYVLAYYRVGRAQSAPTVFSETAPGQDEIVVAQLRHNGDWDPDPSGLSYLMRAVREQTTGDVKFRRAPVDPENADLFAYPFVYLTGQLDFSFSKQARENLRAYLDRGGFLLIVNAAHRVDFDKAVRRELKGVLPDAKLAALPDDHPLFTVQNKLPANPPLDEAAAGKARFDVRIEGADVNGRTAVVYAPIGLGAAWQDALLPFTPSPDRTYALALGVNAIVYAMTH